MTDPPGNPAYRVVTARLVIRCWRLADAVLRRAAIDQSDRYLRPWIPWMRDEPRSLHETAQFIRRERANFDADKDYRYGIFSGDERTLLGETGLYRRAGPGAREIGYWIAQPHAGRGYATEAAAAMVRVAFEVDKVNRVEIICSEANPASAAVAAKLGFRHEATLRDRFEDSEGRLREAMIWTLFADGYPGSPASRHQMSALDCAGAPLL